MQSFLSENLSGFPQFIQATAPALKYSAGFQVTRSSLP